MTVEKLPSGSYRVTQMYKGKRYRQTFDHKPTQKEITQALAQRLDETTQEAHTGTFGDYSQKYLSEFQKRIDKGKASPSTYVGYESISRRFPDSFLDINLYDMTNDDINAFLKNYKKNHSSKTTKNVYGFIKNVFDEYRPNYKLLVKIINDEKKYEYEPTIEDVQRIVAEADKTRYAVAMRLAVLGLRKGEVIALTIEDLDDDNFLHITKDKVKDKNNNWVIKPPKTQASIRSLQLDEALADMIRKQGYIYEGYPDKLYDGLRTIQDKLGLPHFRLHMLRHFCGAYLHYQGFTDEQIMYWMGWDTPDMLRKVYNYNLNPAESQKKITNAFSRLF